MKSVAECPSEPGNSHNPYDVYLLSTNARPITHKVYNLPRNSFLSTHYSLSLQRIRMQDATSASALPKGPGSVRCSSLLLNNLSIRSLTTAYVSLPNGIQNKLEFSFFCRRTLQLVSWNLLPPAYSKAIEDINMDNGVRLLLQIFVCGRIEVAMVRHHVCVQIPPPWALMLFRRFAKS
jgi:hypothetical protein